jgi:hypothetical protein
VKYQEKTFTLPTTSKRMTQTDYEIAVGLRHPDGTLVQPKTEPLEPGEFWITRGDGVQERCRYVGQSITIPWTK